MEVVGVQSFNFIAPKLYAQIQANFGLWLYREHAQDKSQHSWW